MFASLGQRLMASPGTACWLASLHKRRRLAWNLRPVICRSSSSSSSSLTENLNASDLFHRHVSLTPADSDSSSRRSQIASGAAEGADQLQTQPVASAQALAAPLMPLLAVLSQDNQIWLLTHTLLAI